MPRQGRTPTMAKSPRSNPSVRSDQDARPASLTMPRAIARAIDLTLVAAPVLVIGAALGETLSMTFVVGALLVCYLYETLAVATFGATAGKAWMGLEVIDAETGGRPALSRAGTRILVVLAVAGAIQLLVPVGPAAAVFIWGSAAVAADGRGLPDSAAGTAVRRRS